MKKFLIATVAVVLIVVGFPLAVQAAKQPPCDPCKPHTTLKMPYKVVIPPKTVKPPVTITPTGPSKLPYNPAPSSNSKRPYHLN